MDASRTVANASIRRSSSSSPAARRPRNQSVRARRSASESASSSGSSALMAATVLLSDLMTRSLAEPNSRLAKAPIMGARSSRGGVETGETGRQIGSLPRSVNASAGWQRGRAQGEMLVGAVLMCFMRHACLRSCGAAVHVGQRTRRPRRNPGVRLVRAGSDAGRRAGARRRSSTCRWRRQIPWWRSSTAVRSTGPRSRRRRAACRKSFGRCRCS